MTIYSPVEEPENLVSVVSIVNGLGKLPYLRRMDMTYAYEEVNEGIIERRRRFQEVSGEETYVEQWGQADESNRRYGHKKSDWFTLRPSQAAEFVTSPYPVDFLFSFEPEVWADSADFSSCYLRGANYKMDYYVKFDGKRYYIEEQPRSDKNIFLGNTGEDAVTLQFGFSEGIPQVCLDHIPYVETCVPRFKEIREIVEGAGLPVK